VCHRHAQEEDPKAKEEREAREKKKRKELKAKISKLIIPCLEDYYKQKRIASKVRLAAHNTHAHNPPNPNCGKLLV
jgi:hypothetical protein